MIWKPIALAPKHQEIRVGPLTWGPRIWLRDQFHTVIGRWRSEVAGYAILTDKVFSRQARWEDLDGNALTFTPTEWSEIDG